MHPSPPKGSVFLYLLRLLRHLPNFARLFWRLFRDRRVPRYLKAMTIFTVLYILSPIDILPDYMPLIGQLDDLSVLLLMAYYFIHWSPEDVVREHVAAIDQTFHHNWQRWYP